MGFTEFDGERLAAETIVRGATKSVDGRYPAATECSITERGGRIVPTGGLRMQGERVALVGDPVSYDDGRETCIVCRAGAATICEGRPIAVVGRGIANGDHITGPMGSGMVIVQYADEAPLQGLLDPSYVPTQAKEA